MFAPGARYGEPRAAAHVSSEKSVVRYSAMKAIRESVERETRDFLVGWVSIWSEAEVREE